MFYFIKKMIRFSFNLFFIALFLGILFFIYTNYQHLKQVHKYDEKIAIEAKKYGVSEYTDLLSSIILTESKGVGNDPMQSSESKTGLINQMHSPDQSIEQGVSFFSKALEKAKSQNTDIWTAIQAYNFGLDYIDFVSKNGGVTSKKLAEIYSRDILSPKLGNQTKKQYRYLAIHSFIYNGGYLYHNGGNMFYADIVKYNAMKWHLTNKFFQ